MEKLITLHAPPAFLAALSRGKKQTADKEPDEISALVLDPGSSTTRAGFAGEDMPKSVVNTNYGHTASEPFLFGDEKLLHLRPGLEVLNPMGEDGTVEDWGTAQKLWEYSIQSRLISPRQRHPATNGLNNNNKEENGEIKDGDPQAMDIDGAEENEAFLADNPILITEPAWNSPRNREKSIEVAFESWGAPAFYTARSGVLAAYGVPTFYRKYAKDRNLVTHLASHPPWLLMSALAQQA